MLQSALVTVLAPCSIKLLLVVAILTTLAELYAILAMGPAQPDRARHIVDRVSNVVIRILVLYTQYGNMSTAQSISGRPLTDLRMDLDCIIGLLTS